jgi:molecular chaperone GrpE
MSENDQPEDDFEQDIPTKAGANTPGPAAAPPSAEDRVAALEAEKLELRDRMLRIAAEFDNYKKRIRKDMSDQEAKVREAVLRDFLEIADNLERATTSWNAGAAKDAKSVQDGVDLVLRLFKSKLERYAVTAIEAKGQPFDPRVHEAISQAPSAEASPGTVLHELQKGYRVGERLLRPSIVVVAMAPPAAPAPDRSAGGVEIEVNGEEESADGSGEPPQGDKTP